MRVGKLQSPPWNRHVHPVEQMGMQGDCRPLRAGCHHQSGNLDVSIFPPTSPSFLNHFTPHTPEAVQVDIDQMVGPY